MTEDRFAEFGVEQSGHRVFDLVEQFINDAVELDLNAFAFRSGDRHVLHLCVEADDDGVRCACEQNVRFRDRADSCVNNVELDLLALDLLERGANRFDRSLGVAFQNQPQSFLAVGCFEQGLERRALRHT